MLLIFQSSRLRGKSQSLCYTKIRIFFDIRTIVYVICFHYLCIMNKVEKYYNYIVDNLVKDTRIDYDKERIYFPFYSLPFYPSSPSLPFPHHFPLFPPSFFSSYVEGRYGIKKEDIQLLWDQYKQRVQEIIEWMISL